MSETKNIRKIRLGHPESDKFASKAHTKQPHLKYNGGPLLGNVEVSTFFWGNAWKKRPALVTLSKSINSFPTLF
jgi:hypothetical protein